MSVGDGRGQGQGRSLGGAVDHHAVDYHGAAGHLHGKGAGCRCVSGIEVAGVGVGDRERTGVGGGKAEDGAGGIARCWAGLVGDIDHIHSQGGLGVSTFLVAGAHHHVVDVVTARVGRCFIVWCCYKA